MSEAAHSGDYYVFEYSYRDAGNWKTYGALLLAGGVPGMRDAIRDCCESGDCFVAEQVGIPSLCQQHWADCGDAPSDLDHAYHEFVDLHPGKRERGGVIARRRILG